MASNKKFLHDQQGKPSTMRLMSIIALLSSIGFGGLTIYLGSEFGLWITFGFLLSAFAPKSLQKYIENIKI